MKIVLLGYKGMLGHQLAKVLDRQHIVQGIGSDWTYPALLGLLEGWRPHVMINAAGIVKQRTDVGVEQVIETNSLLPHRLYRAARDVGARLIHFSTDCVFSGDLGAYTEDDRPDPVDLYGRSKLLGEVEAEGALTIRTSIIGRELGVRKHGLLEWFLAQRGPVEGYENSYFSGLTTPELSRVVARVLVEQPNISGIWHVAGPGISKYELLERIASAFLRPTEVIPNYNAKCNRTLRAKRFNERVGYTPPLWGTMLRELANG